VLVVLSAVAILRLVALSRGVSSAGNKRVSDWSTEAFPTRLLPMGVGGSGGSYCKRCMYYCPDLELLQKHVETCTADSGDIDKASSHGSDDKESSQERSEEELAAALPVDPARPYRCSRCGRSYQLAQSLQRHRWKCDQSRPMPCTICGAVYYRADNLQNHIKSAHNMGSRVPPSTRQTPPHEFFPHFLSGSDQE